MMKFFRSYMPMVVIFFTFIFFAGCKKNDNVVNTNPANNSTSEVSSNTDAAIAVAANFAIDNGGSLQDVADLLKTGTFEGLNNEDSRGMPDFDNCHSNVVKSYDTASGWWTVTVTSNRGNANGKYYANYQRIYKYQYLDAAGKFQKFYITNKDTAVNASYQIVSGFGILKTPKVSDRLVSLTAAWDAAGINNHDTVTVNTTSPYMRAVSDTITRNNYVRTLNGILTVNFINVISPRWDSPRGGTLNWHHNLSGTIDGTYHAVETFQKDSTVTDTTIDKTIHIVFGVPDSTGVHSKATLTVNNSKFLFDVQTGEVTQ